MQDITFLLVVILLCRRCPIEFCGAGLPVEGCLTNLRKFTVQLRVSEADAAKANNSV